MGLDGALADEEALADLRAESPSTASAATSRSRFVSASGPVDRGPRAPAGGAEPFERGQRPLAAARSPGTRSGGSTAASSRVHRRRPVAAGGRLRGQDRRARLRTAASPASPNAVTRPLERAVARRPDRRRRAGRRRPRSRRTRRKRGNVGRAQRVEARARERRRVRIALVDRELGQVDRGEAAEQPGLASDLLAERADRARRAPPSMSPRVASSTARPHSASSLWSQNGRALEHRLVRRRCSRGARRRRRARPRRPPRTPIPSGARSPPRPTSRTGRGRSAPPASSRPPQPGHHDLVVGQQRVAVRRVRGPAGGEALLRPRPPDRTPSTRTPAGRARS